MGRALLEATCDAGYGDAFVLKLCKQGANVFTRKKMVEELDRVLQLMEDGKVPVLQKSILPKTTPTKQSAKNVVVKKTPVNVEKFPDDLKELDSQIRAWYSQNKIMRGQLRELAYMPTGEPRSVRSLHRSAARRKELCDMVVDTQRKINAAWARIDFYDSHGVHKPGTEPTTEKEQVKKWLANQPQAINYIRQADCLYRKSKIYKDKNKYNEYTKMLAEIKNYINEG